MKRIYKYWNLHDFCYSHGRVIPHTINDTVDFRSFHCADKRHDDSETVVFSENMPTAHATMAGILSMSGFVVEFIEDDRYLFCTKEELERLQIESRIAEDEYNKKKLEEEEALKTILPENPARPHGVAITRENMRIEFQIYLSCPIYQSKMLAAKSRGYTDPSFPMTISTIRDLLCKDDCLFCHCPFYDLPLFQELRYNHNIDYDEWVMEYFKNFKR